ncbi:DUF2381 family protein [Corallococcus sp. Z5C101001]|uniref:DUF2381 family protein n=1 Tax=Corallococcus sp. Z5C101001 TaxID=2596829 RepID=UPI00163DB8A3|nr:DUF2381 family protein [Corallococcus sp. Z5C101001]
MPRLAALLVLLLGTAVPAQPAPVSRERQERRIALPDSPSEPVPELHVAAGALTVLAFDALLDRASVELEGRERFRFLDVGERMLALEPATDLRPGEQLGLRVRFAEGARPEQAIFVLVTQPEEFDGRIQVFRRPQSIGALQAELADMREQLKAKDAELETLRARSNMSSPGGLALAGLLDEDGVSPSRIKPQAVKEMQSSLRVMGGVSLRAPAWSVVSVSVKNYGKTPWTPTEARLTSSTGGTQVPVLGVRMKQSQIGPGEAGTVVVEVEKPDWDAGTVFRLELVDATGIRRVLVPRVGL